MQWNKEYIVKLIHDEVQESLSLEYKRAAALSKEDSKRTEITKDVSAMANSAGGFIIYGIAEYDNKEKRHLPERIDPIDQTLFSKEWLEQVITNIRPRILGVIIHPIQVDISTNKVVYAVEIPQSTTAHMAMDHRYYRRYNFTTQMMEDYEVRDTMGRQQYPIIKLGFAIRVSIPFIDDNNGFGIQTRKVPKYRLIIIAENVGNILAKYVNCFFYIPAFLSDEIRSEELKMGFQKTHQIKGRDYFSVSRDNTIRDVDGFGSMKSYGASWYRPILPGLTHVWEVELDNNSNKYFFDNKTDIIWEIYADNAPMNRGSQLLKNIPIKNSNDL